MPPPNQLLPGLGQRSLVPRPRADLAMDGLMLRDIEGYVLSRIDGRTSLWEICLLVPLKREETLRVLRSLRARGIIEVPGSTEPIPAVEPEPPAPAPPTPVPAPSPAAPTPVPATMPAPPPADAVPDVEVILRPSMGSDRVSPATPSPRPTPASRSAPIALGEAESPPPEAPAAAPPAAATLSDDCDLSPEQRRRIDDLYAQINQADAFTLLGLTVREAADKRVLQRVYFKLSKEFHPDRFFKKQLGPYRSRVTAVFQAITEARDILMDDERRRKYLAGEDPHS